MVSMHVKAWLSDSPIAPRGGWLRGGWLALVWALAASSSWTLSACSSGERGEDTVVPVDEVVPRPAEPPPAPPPLLDAEGRLLPSERALGGLTLPRGLENEQSGANRHIFEAPFPAAKLVQYFGPRLLTGRVEPNGTGARFIGATPLHADGAAFQMDVLVVERGAARSSVIIRIINAPSPTATPPTEEELRTFHERLD